MNMTIAMQQRLREAVKAELDGRAVRLCIEDGGAGKQLVAMYRVQEFARESRHPIFTGSAGLRFDELVSECKEYFSALVMSEVSRVAQ
jgi:hypothetical protein